MATARCFRPQVPAPNIMVRRRTIRSRILRSGSCRATRSSQNIASGPSAITRNCFRHAWSSAPRRHGSSGARRLKRPIRFAGASIDYLSRNPVTGLLIAKDDQILFEHYQYGRTDRDLLLSQSMVKSITGLLIGIAIGDGAIKSVDDTAETYVPGLKGTEYGATPLRALLHMSSGVDFGEEQDKGRDLDRLWIDMVRGTGIRRARLPASRNSTGGSRRRGRGSTTPASNPTCSASCCITPSTNPPPSISVKKSGSRSARKPTPNG